jgi:hypothetical protein
VCWKNCKNQLLASSRPSVRPSVWNLAPNGRIFMKFNITAFFVNLLRKFKFHQNLTRIAGTLHEYQYILLIMSRLVLIGKRNVSDKICTENQKTHLMFSKPPLRKSCRSWDMWTNSVQPNRSQIRCMRFACCVRKATNMHSEYVILIVFLLQQWLHEGALMTLRVHCLCCCYNVYNFDDRPPPPPPPHAAK